MLWIRKALDILAGKPDCGYRAGGRPAVEPSALAALALLKAGRVEPAALALDWLADVQASDGSLGVDGSTPRPSWTTGWAVLAWQAALPGQDSRATKTDPQAERRQGDEARWTVLAERAAAWILSTGGHTHPRPPEVAHDTTLQGWPWVESTDSWVEPTAISLMALKASGQADHPRSREAVRLLLDRMLPSGGWNYGNTVVLGNTLRPHVQPTGLALAALTGEPSASRHVKRSLAYLKRALSQRRTTASLCYALIGAAAHGYRPEAADRWLQAAANRELAGEASPYKLALLTLACCVPECAWLARILSRRAPHHEASRLPSASTGM